MAEGQMTEAMYYVLLALMNESAHGYQLMSDINDISNGRINLGPGTLYGILGRFLDDGYVIIIEESRRRKVYEITELGEEALRNEYRRITNMVLDGAIL